MFLLISSYDSLVVHILNPDKIKSSKTFNKKGETIVPTRTMGENLEIEKKITALHIFLLKFLK